MPVRMAYDYFVNKTMPPPPVIAQTLAIVGARRPHLLRVPASFLPFTAVSSQPPFYLSRKLLCRLRRLHGDQVGSTTVQDGTCRINRIHLRHCAPPLHGRPACIATRTDVFRLQAAERLYCMVALLVPPAAQLYLTRFRV